MIGKKDCEITLLLRKVHQYLQDQMEVENETGSIPVISKGSLALYNGTDREPIWIAYKGLVYDVTKSKLWKNGRHYEHWAGQDLTEELKDAPHAEWVFDKFDVVARLQ